MSRRTRARRLRRVAASLLLLAAALAVPEPIGAAVNHKAWDVGIGSDAARTGPLCDPQTAKIKIPSYLAAVCVRPWEAGADNGGSTYRGVTRDSIKAVAYVAPNDVQLSPPGGGQPPRNRSTGSNGIIQDAILDSQQALEGRYESYGRKIEWSFVTYSGTDEASQRADAIKVAELEPFTVVATTGGNVFITEVAARKILVSFGGAGTQRNNLAQQPYRFTGQDADLHAAHVAKWLGAQVAGRKAEHAGDPGLQGKTRTFGVVYQTSASTGDQFDLDYFDEQLAKNGVPKPAVKVAFTAPDDSTQATTDAQAQAPQIAAKLKDAGVTSVLLLVSPTVVAPLTKAATANEYAPEWVMTGWAYQELGLFAAQYDPDQWAHAFGMSWFAPYASANAGAVTGENVFDWYWGKDKATTSSGAFPAVYYLNQGVHLAGPNLTPQTFKKGAFKMPGRGGAFDDQVTTQGNKVGDLGLGYPEYALLGPKDFALVWWDPDARGLGNILGNEMTSGNYRYLDGGTRYTLQDWKKGDPKFFEDLDTSVTHYDTLPDNDVPPEYPCDACPSTGGAQAPANVRSSGA
jgi:hypothetical protein